ncbi:receptor-like protein 14 [Mangifera indica]|uniref:receptor-like protein 14 n=1 Tax=Mangifera indica TaxID=29780 RepID=UPI001CFA93CF|nr:receptor-like protein 14 [Mangifera indica]
MMERLLIKLLLMVAIVLVQAYGFKGFLEKERIGLLELKSFIRSVSNNETEKILVSWVDDKASNYCEWERVQCNATIGRVIKLSLNYTVQIKYIQDLRRLPTLNLSLFHPFEELRSLDLSENNFGGCHENKANDGFRSLKKLKILDLSYNYFNVTFLSYLTTITSLTTLNLESNNLGEGLKWVKQGIQYSIN